MDTSHPEFIQPENPNNLVWRYLTADKFFDLLKENCLRLSRLDLLGDPFEASLTKGQAKHAAAMQAVLGWSGRHYDGSSPEIFRKRLYASCWQMSDHESSGMWQLYVPKNGLAFQSTFGKLADSYKDENVRIGCVDYINFEDESFNGFKGLSVAMTKRLQYRHEQEVRIIALHEITGENQYPDSINLPWNLKHSIDRIFISPYADERFKEDVEETLRGSGFHGIPVLWSSIKREPYY